MHGSKLENKVSLHSILSERLHATSIGRKPVRVSSSESADASRARKLSGQVRVACILILL